MNLYTIGFTQKSAEQFFALLRGVGVGRILDVRLNNISQLAGFAKKRDLTYFLEAILGIEYVHLPELAPTKEMLDGYKKGGGDWALYERQYLDLLQQRRVEDLMSRDLFDGGCLLCSEDRPHHCHRRLVAEYLTERWGGIHTTHLY